MEPLVSVVIPTYNKKNDAIELIESVYAQDYKNFELIVVDNNSKDGTPQMIKKKFKKARVIINKKNTGVCGGRNKGIENSKGDYIIVIDHDTFVDKKMISSLVRFMEKNPEAGVAGPIVYYYHDKNLIWCAGSAVNLYTGLVKFYGPTVLDEGQFKEPFEVQEIPSAFIFRKDVINKGVKFDEFIFATYEDADFCMNTINIGYKVYLVPEAKLWHKVHKPSGVNSRLQNIGFVTPRRAYYVGRNKLIFMTKHAPKLGLLTFLIFFQPLLAGFYTFNIVKERRFDILKYYWKGIFDGLKFFGGNFWK